MRLTCPACGAIASAEAWRNETTIRQFMGRLEGLPHAVRELALPYLGLFRVGQRGLAWPRAFRLISELSALVEPGTVHWDGGEERPCPPRVWAEAIQATLARRPKALENHNYLRRVAWDLAEQLAAEAERRKDYTASHREHISDPMDRPMTDDERREWTEQMKAILGKIGG